jgi:hypothetical protein
MRGTIKYINPSQGMVAVLTEEGQYSIFELLCSDPVELGDVVSWNLATALGGEHVTNHTQGERYEVYFQNHDVQLLQLPLQLLL